MCWAWLKVTEHEPRMEVISEFGKCVLIGVKDSIVGAWPVVNLLRK